MHAIALLGLCLTLPTYAADNLTAHTPHREKASKTTTKTKLKWRDLTPTQQQILAPLAPEWGGLGSFRKKKWLELSDRYAKMSPAAQERMQMRIEDWAKLSPEQRRKARQSYLRAKKLTPEQKAARWEHYQQLPEEKKEKLAATAPNRKSIVNPPLIHNKKTAAPQKNAASAPSAPASIEQNPTVPVQSEHKSEASNEPDGDSAP